MTPALLFLTGMVIGFALAVVAFLFCVGLSSRGDDEGSRP